MIATQVPTDLGPSAINDAEKVIDAATRTLLPARPHGDLPDLVVFMVDDRGQSTPFCAEFSHNPDDATIAASFTSSLPWEPLIEAHAELDRGRGYVVPTPEPFPWSLVWHMVELSSVVDVHPFRQACLAADRRLSTRFRLWLRRGRRACCWYHQCDWRAASAMAIDQLAANAARREPGAEALMTIRKLSASARVSHDAALSLLLDPIHVSSDGSLTNGQHRVRAMLDQGVHKVPATRSVHDDELAEILAVPGTYCYRVDVEDR